MRGCRRPYLWANGILALGADGILSLGADGILAMKTETGSWLRAKRSLGLEPKLLRTYVCTYGGTGGENCFGKE